MIEISLNRAEPGIPLNEIKEIIQAVLTAADPYQLVDQNLEMSANQLRVGEKLFELHSSTRIVVIGLGKASLAMAHSAEKKIGTRISQGVCVCKHLPEQKILEKVEVFESAHPIPDNRSVEAALKIKQVVSGLGKEDIVLLLLSGGGSALACLPADGVTLNDIQKVTGQLLRSGASINEMNTVRKHLDVFKGGGLLRLAQPAQVAVLVLSDVVGNPLDVIASGPAIMDTSSFSDALEIITKYISPTEISVGILEHLKNGINKEMNTNKGAEHHTNRTAYHKVIGSNVISVNAAAVKTRQLGFTTKILTYALQGESRYAWKELMQEPLPRPCVLFAGGETTVTVRGNGLGGRNLEVALGSVESISKMKNVVLVTFATDGEDGPTDAAGAVVSSEMNPDYELLNTCLQNNDSYNYFLKNGGLIKTGPSGTNVNDITFVICY